MSLYKTKYNKWYALYIIATTQDENQFYAAYRYITERQHGRQISNRLWEKIK